MILCPVLHSDSWSNRFSLVPNMNYEIDILHRISQGLADSTHAPNECWQCNSIQSAQITNLIVVIIKSSGNLAQESFLLTPEDQNVLVSQPGTKMLPSEGTSQWSCSLKVTACEEPSLLTFLKGPLLFSASCWKLFYFAKLWLWISSAAIIGSLQLYMFDSITLLWTCNIQQQRWARTAVRLFSPVQRGAHTDIPGALHTPLSSFLSISAHSPITVLVFLFLFHFL